MEIPAVLARLVNDVLDNRIARGAIGRANDARDTALATQDAVLGLLNLPTATEVGTVLSRIKSLSQRMELLEDSVEQLNATMSRIERHLAEQKVDAQV